VVPELVFQSQSVPRLVVCILEGLESHHQDIVARVVDQIHLLIVRRLLDHLVYTIDQN
jgi:hypothetical protein